MASEGSETMRHGSQETRMRAAIALLASIYLLSLSAGGVALSPGPI